MRLEPLDGSILRDFFRMVQGFFAKFKKLLPSPRKERLRWTFRRGNESQDEGEWSPALGGKLH